MPSTAEMLLWSARGKLSQPLCAMRTPAEDKESLLV